MAKRSGLKRIAGAATLGAAILIGLPPRPAEANYIVTLEQVGANVVATGSGSIGLTGLSFTAAGFVSAGVAPSTGFISTGPASSQSIDDYVGFSGPSNFGGGLGTLATSGSGDKVGIRGVAGIANGLWVPAGYVSGDPLSDTSTYDSATFASLGVTPGTYVWTWAGIPGEDSFTLVIGVPEPAGILLLAPPLGFVLLLGARRQRALRA
jgi:hypothetical protein